MQKTKLSKEQLTVAKREYMNYKPVAEIARSMGIKRTTLQHYVNELWRSERALRRNELAAEFSESKSAIMNHTFSSSFKGVRAWVDKVTDPSYDMKPHEAKTLLSIIEGMDKIMRLDQGSPTDIISETKPISVIEVRDKILKADPFQIEEVGFKEIEDVREDKEDTEANS